MQEKKDWSVFIVNTIKYLKIQVYGKVTKEMALKKVTTISPLISIWMVKPLLFFKVPFVG